MPAWRGAGPEHAVLQDDPTPIPAKSHGAESPPGPWQSGSFNLKKCLQDIGIEIPTVRSRLRAGIFIPNIALRGHARRARCRRGQEAPVAAAPNPRAFSGLGGAWKASTALPVMNCKALRENQELKRKKKKPARSQIGDRMSVRLTRAAQNIQGSEGARSVGWEPDETDGQMEASPARQILANKFFPGGRRQAQLSSRGRNENTTWVGAWSLRSLPQRAPRL